MRIPAYVLSTDFSNLKNIFDFVVIEDIFKFGNVTIVRRDIS